MRMRSTTQRHRHNYVASLPPPPPPRLRSPGRHCARACLVPPRPSTAAARCAPPSTVVKGDANPPGTHDSAANALTCLALKNTAVPSEAATYHLAVTATGQVDAPAPPRQPSRESLPNLRSIERSSIERSIERLCKAQWDRRRALQMKANSNTGSEAQPRNALGRAAIASAEIRGAARAPNPPKV